MFVFVAIIELSSLHYLVYDAHTLLRIFTF